MSEETNVPSPQPNPSDDRRNRPADQEYREVEFARRQISQEKIEALKRFLVAATADDIAAVRNLYGDDPQILRLIGLEVGASTEKKDKAADDSTGTDGGSNSAD